MTPKGNNYMKYAPSTNTLGLHLVRFKFPAAGRGGLNILSVQAESNKTMVLYYLVSQNTFRTCKETPQKMGLLSI